jgi:hypothetical protein
MRQANKRRECEAETAQNELVQANSRKEHPTCRAAGDDRRYSLQAVIGHEIDDG